MDQLFLNGFVYLVVKIVMAVKPVLQCQVREHIRRLRDEDLSHGIAKHRLFGHGLVVVLAGAEVPLPDQVHGRGCYHRDASLNNSRRRGRGSRRLHQTEHHHHGRKYFFLRNVNTVFVHLID